jgi:hypothetical protein
MKGYDPPEGYDDLPSFPIRNFPSKPREDDGDERPDGERNRGEPAAPDEEEDELTRLRRLRRRRKRLLALRAAADDHNDGDR